MLDIDKLRRGTCAFGTHEIDLRLGLLYLADTANLLLLLWVELLDFLQLRVDLVFYLLDQLRKLAEKLIVDPDCRGLFGPIFSDGHQKSISKLMYNVKRILELRKSLKGHLSAVCGLAADMVDDASMLRVEEEDAPYLYQ